MDIRSMGFDLVTLTLCMYFVMSHVDASNLYILFFTSI